MDTSDQFVVSNVSGRGELLRIRLATLYHWHKQMCIVYIHMTYMRVPHRAMVLLTISGFAPAPFATTKVSLDC